MFLTIHYSLSTGFCSSSPPFLYLNFDSESGEGKVGRALVCEGNEGVDVELAEDINTQKGFSFEVWVKFDDIRDNYNVASRDGEFLLRIDPPNEGSRLSFFVNVNNSLEPRVSSFTPEPGKWYRVVAGWDRKDAFLWVDDKLFKIARSGSLKKTSNPIVIAKSFKWAPAGLRGAIDEFKF